MPDGILNGSGPHQLLFLGLPEHRHERSIVGAEYLSHNVRMVLVHLHEKRLQAALANIPLQRAKAHSLVIEVAGQPGKTIRRRMVGFQASGERQTLTVE